jgi:hypothetical protein
VHFSKIVIVSAGFALMPFISHAARLNSAPASFSGGMTLDNFSCTRTHEEFVSPSQLNRSYDDLWVTSDIEVPSCYRLGKICSIPETSDPTPAPEPSSIAMLAIGLLGGATGLLRRRAKLIVKKAYPA